MIKLISRVLLIGIFFGFLVTIHPWPTLSMGSPIYYQDRVVVLLYHDFKTRENGTAINARRLQAHFRLLAARGFHIISLDQVVGFVEGKHSVPPNAIAITMDDGYSSNYTVAYPLLKQRHWPATIFLTVANTGRLEGKRSQCRWLDWEQINTMQHNGISFGSHTYNAHFFTLDSENRQLPWLLAKLPSENNLAYYQRISEDFKLAQAIMEKQLGEKTYHFAAPFGMYDNSVVKAGQSSGLKYFWSTEQQPITRNSSRFRMGRLSVGIKGTSAKMLFDKIMVTAEKNKS